MKTGANYRGNAISEKFQLELEDISVYGDDPIEPKSMYSLKSLDEFKKTLKHSLSYSVLFNFNGLLFDTLSSISITIDSNISVVEISTPEDIIWNFSEDISQAKFARLERFAKFCEAITGTVKPKRIYIGTETIHFDEIIKDDALSLGAVKYSQDFFKESNLRELYNWYVGVYAKRWEK